MDAQDAVYLGQQAIVTTLIIAAPLLIVGMLVGLAIGLLQALTQVQDQTIAFVPKLVAMVLVLVLLPAVFLLFSGPSYRDTTKRIFGAVLFAALAFALLIEPLGSALVLQGEGRAIYEFFVDNRVYIVTVGLVFAVFDLLGAHIAKPLKKDKH